MLDNLRALEEVGISRIQVTELVQGLDRRARHGAARLRASLSLVWHVDGDDLAGVGGRARHSYVQGTGFDVPRSGRTVPVAKGGRIDRDAPRWSCAPGSIRALANPPSTQAGRSTWLAGRRRYACTTSAPGRPPVLVTGTVTVSGAPGDHAAGPLGAPQVKVV